ncbi:uncharacterized protein SCHCODRAFT_02514947 [Schizophyllum commune H4-8]|nr:uncharacterized protein SCHCODRAFT_02514947 [Schizophyllum commune H4-8]KAI5887725.1 hypothetical protein SCHCODRAFT_02514947 [Schizophyllum commune H4-8]
MGPTRQCHLPNAKVNIGRLSKRSLESWAAQLGVLHVADGVPENQRAMTLQRELARLARNGTDMRNGQLRRLPMSESEWPNMPYRLLHGLPMKGAIAKDDPRRDTELSNEQIKDFIMTKLGGKKKRRALKWIDKRIEKGISGADADDDDDEE